jgi:hypothetical protein
VDVELEAVGRHDPSNRRAPAARVEHPQSVEVAAEAEGRAIDEAASSRERRPLAGEAFQVPPDPAFALAQERVDPRLRMCPPPPRGRRQAHDETHLRVDRDPEMTRSVGVAKDVREGRTPG